MSATENTSAADYDYVVVGSGAGGGPLAANLARAGFSVLLLEAGGDPCSEEGDEGRFLYEVPVFHGHSTEYAACSWDYFVRHFTKEEYQERDWKAKTVVDGRHMVWYPRAGALGGCTAHNAMIMVAPQDSDWNHIAEATGDDSWRAEKMRPYFARLEACRYAPRPGTLKGFISGLVSFFARLFFGQKDGGHGHGFDGWLPTSGVDPRLLLPLIKDEEIGLLVLNTVKAALREHVGDPLLNLEVHLDPNDGRNASREGLVFAPLTVDKGKRVGPREYLLSVEKDPACRLTIRKRAFVTRVLFEGKRAVGVEYIDKGHVYRADPAAKALTPDPASLPRERVRVKAEGEVILAGGAFNTPQLLMLSGVGPRQEIERFGIPLVAELPGVGENLQDRYEIGVVSQYEKDFALLGGGTFAPPGKGDKGRDELFDEWAKKGAGIYATNGALVALTKRSRKDLEDPDLFIFGLPANFRGYYQGYSKELERLHNKFSWIILKARTSNTGSVKLSSANPWDTPLINFRNFGDGERADDPDLEALVTAVGFVRDMNARLARLGVNATEELPGPDKQGDALRDFIRVEAWGHHASCTCKIGGDDDETAVLDSRFRVRGTEGLRVVDASVFPKIPGYFIVSAIYMISEKASDVIIEDAGGKR